jgi:hypothetical protein
MWWCGLRSIRLRAIERARVTVTRSGTTIYDTEFTSNTPFLIFEYHCMEALTSDYFRVCGLKYIEVRSGGTVLGSASLSNTDISYDTATKTLTVVKSVTITTTGTADRIVLKYRYTYYYGAGSATEYFTEVILPSPVSVRVNDVVTVMYTLKLYMVVSNPGGLLSDATLDDSGVVLRIYECLKTDQCLQLLVGKVAYVDTSGNEVLIVTTRNDTSNWIIVAPTTNVTVQFDLAKIVFKTPDNLVLMVWTKATPQTIQAGSYLATRVAVYV